MSDMRFYRAQERAMAPGIVTEWPKVWRMPRKVPNGRLVAVSVQQVIAELRDNGYLCYEPEEAQDVLDAIADATAFRRRR
jgi:hypothetical protein